MDGVNRHTGERYGRCTLLYPVGYEKCHTQRWRVRCDCGREFEAAFNNIRSGRTRSCGCLRREATTARNMARKKNLEISPI